MNTEALLKKKRNGYILLSGLILFAFSLAFYARVLTLLKFPSIVNQLHLVVIPWLCIFALFKTRLKDRSQIFVTKQLLTALVFFFGVNLASALLNNAGLINVFVNFLLLCEHFLFMLAIISIPMTPEKLEKFRAYLLLAGFINTFFAFVQRYVLNLHLRPGLEDNIKGVFIGGGSWSRCRSICSAKFWSVLFFECQKCSCLDSLYCITSNFLAHEYGRRETGNPGIWCFLGAFINN